MRYKPSRQVAARLRTEYGTAMLDKELRWLQQWYAAQCDGDWEHSYGIRIETLDNPGWSVTIDLSETELASLPFEEIRADMSENDWLFCSVDKNNRFIGFGDTTKLIQLLRTFRTWASNRR